MTMRFRPQRHKNVRESFDCAHCGATVILDPPRATYSYACPACVSKARRGAIMARYNSPPAPVPYTCKTCGKECRGSKQTSLRQVCGKCWARAKYQESAEETRRLREQRPSWTGVAAPEMSHDDVERYLNSVVANEIAPAYLKSRTT